MPKTFERYRTIAKLDDEILQPLGEMLDLKRLSLTLAFKIAQLKSGEITAVLSFLKKNPDEKVKGKSFQQ